MPIMSVSLSTGAVELRKLPLPNSCHGPLSHQIPYKITEDLPLRLYGLRTAGEKPDWWKMDSL